MFAQMVVRDLDYPARYDRRMETEFAPSNQCVFRPDEIAVSRLHLRLNGAAQDPRFEYAWLDRVGRFGRLELLTSPKSSVRLGSVRLLSIRGGCALSGDVLRNAPGFWWFTRHFGRRRSRIITGVHRCPCIDSEWNSHTRQALFQH